LDVKKKSIFIINTMSKKINVSLAKTMTDRITGAKRANNFELNPYEIVWLE
jgi:hypothetical protein